MITIAEYNKEQKIIRVIVEYEGMIHFQAFTPKAFWFFCKKLDSELRINDFRLSMKRGAPPLTVRTQRVVREYFLGFLMAIEDNM